MDVTSVIYLLFAVAACLGIVALVRYNHRIKHPTPRVDLDPYAKLAKYHNKWNTSSVANSALGAYGIPSPPIRSYHAQKSFTPLRRYSEDNGSTSGVFGGIAEITGTSTTYIGCISADTTYDAVGGGESGGGGAGGDWTPSIPDTSTPDTSSSTDTSW